MPKTQVFLQEKLKNKGNHTHRQGYLFNQQGILSLQLPKANLILPRIRVNTIFKLKQQSPQIRPRYILSFNVTISIFSFQLISQQRIQKTKLIFKHRILRLGHFHFQPVQVLSNYSIPPFKQETENKYAKVRFFVTSPRCSNGKERVDVGQQRSMVSQKSACGEE